MSRAPLSVVVIAKNEQDNLPRCLQALSWADEVVVVDDYSKDDTVRVAEDCGARVLQHRFESFAAQRNWAIREGGLRNDWVLMLDADEVATPEFAEEIIEKVSFASPETVAFGTCRKTMMGDSWLKYSDGFPVWIMRVVRRGSAWFEDCGHGEVPFPQIEGEAGQIAQPFLHYPFSRGMDDWWRRHAAYAGREARKESHCKNAVGYAGLLSLNSCKRRRAIRQFSTHQIGRAHV